MATLLNRVKYLEGRRSPLDTRKDRELSMLGAACKALLKALEDAHSGASIDLLHELWHRLNTGTATDADRDMLAALPVCDTAPNELVRTMVELDNSV